MTTPAHAHRSWPLPAWQLYLGAVPLLVTAYYLAVSAGPDQAGLQVALYCSANGLSTAAVVYLAWRHRTMRTAGLLLAAGCAFSVAADVIFYWQALVNGEVAYPSIADIGYLADYPLVAAGLLVIVRRRTPGWNLASVVDAAIVAVSAGYLTFVLVIDPTMQVTTGWDAAGLVSVAYPVGDLMLIAVGARLLLGAGPRPVALRLIGVFLGLILFADTMYGVQTLAGTYQAGNYLDAVWMTASITLGAALLHPSAHRLFELSPVATPDATTGRLAALTVAATLAPTSLLVQHLRGADLNITVAAIVCIALFLLVLVRMTGLVAAQRHAAITDGLTALRTRRFFEQALRTETDRNQRHGRPVGVLLLDIDHFKTVNDTFGHQGGDRVLVEVSRRLRDLVRPGDLVARYGGEEFAVLMPGADDTDLQQVAERVRRGIAAAPVAVGDGRLHQVTASIGAAGTPLAQTGEELMLAADRALYAAKEAGRNQVANAAVVARGWRPQPEPRTVGA